MQTGKPWTDQENLFLKKYYPTKGGKYVADKLGRTLFAVYSQGQKLREKRRGYHNYGPYSPQEIILLKKNYPLKGSRYVAEKLGRSPSSVKTKAKNLRVERKSLLMWSKGEIEYLKKWYNKKRPSKIAHHLKRTTPAIVTRARMLGLLIRETRKWNNNEELFLIRNFRKMTYKQIGKHLNRTESSVSHKAKNMLTMKKLIIRKWEPKEKRLLSRLYGKMPVAELAARLGRTVGSVLHRARVQKISLKAAPAYTEDEKNFIRENYLIMTNVQIARMLNRTTSGILIKAKRLGFTGNTEKKRLWERGIRKESGYNYSESEKEFIRNNYLKITNVQIAEKLNRTVKGIQSIAVKMGLTGSTRKRRLWQRGQRAKKY